MRAIVTHPANLSLLRRASAPAPTIPIDASTPEPGPTIATAALAGIPIFADPNVEQYARRWQPPRERFVEYEQRDLPWLEYFGIGRREATREPAFYLIDTNIPRITRAETPDIPLRIPLGPFPKSPRITPAP